jgi:uncharacterized protein
VNALLENKMAVLEQLLQSFRPLVIAYSGGTDSTFLVKIAHSVLGNDVVATIVSSPLHPKREYEAAVDGIAAIGVRCETIQANLMAIPELTENPPDRCYHCKKALFTMIVKSAREQGVFHVAEGSNADDTSDYRPGMKALLELGIRSPLRDVNLAKEEIRELSLALGLPTWNKPAEACLASRFPYGERITPAKLKRVEEAEAHLRCLGFKEIRVRFHGNLARIEVSLPEVPRFMDRDLRASVSERLKKAGFTYVAVDLEGYRRGSLN